MDNSNSESRLSQENSIAQPDSQKQLILDAVEQWGNHASASLLERPCSVFRMPEIRGIIGYCTAFNCNVVLGDPLCDQKDRLELVSTFQDQSKQEGKRVVYVNTSEQFAHWGTDLLDGSCMGVGDEVILNPQFDILAQTGFNPRSLRNKFQKASRDGITVKEYVEFDPHIEKSIEELGAQWLARRNGVQTCLFPLNIFGNRNGKRWLYAQHNNKIIGLLMINKIDAFKGWVLNMLICSADAPSTTSEFLVLCGLRTLRQEGCSFFTIGTTPRSELGTVKGLNSISTWLARTGYKLSRKLLKIDERQRYWHKFEPEYAQTYILFNKPYAGLIEYFAIMRIMNSI